jgi:hypothetical protein
VHRFRLMGIYVVLVVAALGFAIAGIAILRAVSPTHAFRPHGPHHRSQRSTGGPGASSDLSDLAGSSAPRSCERRCRPQNRADAAL